MLAQCETGDHDQLLNELLRLDISLRYAAGEQPAVADYVTRFPDRLSLIKSAISRLASGEETVDLKTEQSDSTADFTGDLAASRKSTDSSSLQPRRSIGRYTIIGTLGRGGQADVFRAAHPTLLVEVAIKLTHNTLSEKAREALRGEAHILCDLDHPHIARIRDFGFDDAPVHGARFHPWPIAWESRCRGALFPQGRARATTGS